MKPIPTGQFIMGSEQHYPEERPAHERSVSAFEMDSTTVTNADFEKFVTETGYLTTAEIPFGPGKCTRNASRLLHCRLTSFFI